jgi:hypothetical protein
VWRRRKKKWGGGERRDNYDAAYQFRRWNVTLSIATSVNIARSVGRGGANLPGDVRVIQTLLTQAYEQPAEKELQPGPVDGTCTPKLIKAIETFQKRFTKHADGRIDPAGQTIKKLVKVTYNNGGSCVDHPPTGRALVSLLLPKVGDIYYYGAAVPKENDNWIGPWDCAEFVAWGIYQLTGRIIGCRRDKAPNGVWYDNSYTGYFATDLPSVATQISLQEAADTIGAIALRAPGNPGHIAVSRGGNKTIEAYDTANGVKSAQLKGRNWTSYWKLNFLSYEPGCSAM